MSLLVRASYALPSDFGEAMPVLFEVPVDLARLSAWVSVLEAVNGYELPDLFAPFLSEDQEGAIVSVQVTGVHGGFLAVPSVADAEGLFGRAPREASSRFRLVPPGSDHSRLDLRVREVTLHITGEGAQWAANLTDVEEQVTFRTPPLGTADLMELQLQMCPPEDRAGIFEALIGEDPQRASHLLLQGLPDPWDADPATRRPLRDLPHRVLAPLLNHVDAEIRSRSQSALGLSP